jgi:hypothetical protein
MPLLSLRLRMSHLFKKQTSVVFWRSFEETMALHSATESLRRFTEGSSRRTSLKQDIAANRNQSWSAKVNTSRTSHYRKHTQIRWSDDSAIRDNHPSLTEYNGMDTFKKGNPGPPLNIIEPIRLCKKWGRSITDHGSRASHIINHPFAALSACRLDENAVLLYT